MIDGLPRLGELFGVVWMPPEVGREVLPNRGVRDETAILATEAAGWLKQTDAPPAPWCSPTLMRETTRVRVALVRPGASTVAAA